MKRFSIVCVAYAAAYMGAIGANPTVIENGVLDLCRSNTSSDYVVYDTPLSIPVEIPLSVYTSRYTEFKPTIVGEGTLSLYCGGERTFIGDQKGNTYPDWSNFTGDVHIYPWTEVEPNAGFYGVILNSGGKRFYPEDMQSSLETVNSQLIDNVLIIHDGATLATPTGARGARIGHLETMPGSRIFGSIKKSSSSTPSSSYIVVGGDGSDSQLAGIIRSVDDIDTPLGIVKEGEGCYVVSGNDNIINGAIRILQGTILINNDADQAQAEGRQGSIGANPKGLPGIYVFQGANLGGTGHSASTIDLYGKLMPGNNGIGTLRIADYATGTHPSLRLRPTAKLHFEIASSEQYDCIEIDGNLDFYNIRQDFQPSKNLPIVYIEPTDDNTLAVGDELTLIKAAGKTAYNDVEWNLRIQYPKSYTWECREEEDDNGYRLVAKLVSLDYSGQGDEILTDEEQTYPSYDDIEDGVDDSADESTLRRYATAIDKKVGVAVCTWRVSGFDNENNAEIQTISAEYNALVAENEMKFDALQPSKGRFSYNDGDRIVTLAQRADMYLRGHALAWHKQMPEWLSGDGGVKNDKNYTREELLEILENHITNVLTHYKGQVKEWDVVNECLSDEQDLVRSNPGAYALRPSVWLTGIGEDYIDSAFVYAHRADPDALLILNEYGAEFIGNAKTEALYNLAKRLVDNNIPIHGIGLQCHLDAGQVDASRLGATIDKYRDLGLNCIITELDLGISSKTSENLQMQADDFAAIARVAAQNDNCRGLMFWGFSDDQSWRDSYPLLLDNAHKRKPGYYAVRRVLRKASGLDILGIPSLMGSPKAIEIRRFDLLGRPVPTSHRGVTIEQTVYSDGTTSATKKAE